jgi:hypothetical protein
MLVPINLTGGSYKHESLPLSAQVTRNWWPQLQQNDKTKSRYVLAPFVGMKAWHTADYTGADRGMLAHRGVLYKVTGQSLYSFDQFGEKTLLGTIPGVLRCVMYGANESVIIVTGGVAYEWNGTTLNTGADPDFETPNAGTFLNGRSIYDGDNGRFGVTDVGDHLSINGLNYATAESMADDLIRPYAFEQWVYMMGEESIEPWWNSGQGSPPFDLVQNALMSIGLAGVHAVTHNDDLMYILDDESQTQAIKKASHRVVSPHAITAEIETYSVKSDAILWAMTIEGQKFIVETFPSADKTWVYVEGAEWFEWSSGNEGGRCIANSHAYIFGKNLVADYRNGNIYELDIHTYDEVGEPIIRTRDSAPLHSGHPAIGKPGKELELNRFELIVEPGVGLNTGQGSDPIITLAISTDGGKTWGSEMQASLGEIGHYGQVVEWAGLNMRSESFLFRIRISDPVRAIVYSAGADIEVGI